MHPTAAIGGVSQQDKSTAPANDLAARAAALGVLESVLRRNRSVDDSFESRVAALEPRDRAFVRLLVATTLRRLGQLDAVLATFVTRPPPERVADLLRLGAAQLLFLGTPAYAAVATTVALTKRDHGPLAGLVNAVLRRVVENGAALVAGHDAARLNTPHWLWNAWLAAYGEPATRATAEIHMAEPPLDLTLKDPATAADMAVRLEAAVLPMGNLRRHGTGRIQDLAGFAEGAWWVQDAAAALPAKILLHALGGGAGKEVLDLCAAPGGKTAQLSAAGCRVTAIDVAANRLRLLHGNLKRLGLTATVVAADALTWRPKELVDGVLLDAPCSATGTLRRHPDLPHLKRPDDIPQFVALQTKLLAAAAEMVRPGGFLFYSVCSLQPEERRPVIEAMLAANPSFAQIKIPTAAVAGESQFIAPGGELRTLPSQWPERGGLDGFYGALLQRT